MIFLTFFSLPHFRFLFTVFFKTETYSSAFLARHAVYRRIFSKVRIRDWRHRYGYSPALLETFVETQCHRGTCYKAANWINIGQTAGRGKKSKSHQQLIAVKDIWMRPLRTNFATVLCR
jgi:hypothetical protein